MKGHWFKTVQFYKDFQKVYAGKGISVRNVRNLSEKI